MIEKPWEYDFRPVPDDEAMSLIGEGVHTGLRKGSEAPSSSHLWRHISESDDGGWTDALRFAVEGLQEMGYVLCKALPPCTAVMWHGPGHQSKTRCELHGEHTEHSVRLFGTHVGIFEWEGDEGYA